ncbi:MAG: hypothetical protein H0V45_05380 [Actinobacteria bacterium]|nr:hypothetical protein [Actinomycetota bacterium]
MVENSSARGRLVRRAAGLGAAALFFSGLLVALGFDELVIAGAVVGTLGTFAAGTAWLVARHREKVATATATAYAAAVPILARLSRTTWELTLGLAATTARAGRATAIAAAAGFSVCARSGRHVARHAAPMAKSAKEQLVLRLRVVVGTVRRQASRGAAVVAADISHHRKTLRAARARPRAELRRKPDRAVSRRLSAAVCAPPARARSRVEDDSYRSNTDLPRLPVAASGRDDEHGEWR